ncbi:MAG: hypothetical protein AB1589_02290 [Cyanobacteriota bacterium]
MSAPFNNKPIQKLLSMAGIATASVFFCLPGLAEVAPNAGGINQPLNSNRQTGSTLQTGQLLAQNPSSNERYDNCGGYEGNATTGGGFYCARYRLYPNGAPNSQSRTAPAGSSYQNNGGSTTGAGYPGNNVTPQGGDNNMNQESTNMEDNTQNQTRPAGSSYQNNGGSTTGAGYPGNNVTPQGGDNNMNR